MASNLAAEGSFVGPLTNNAPFGGVVLVSEPPMLSPIITSQAIGSDVIGLPDPPPPVIKLPNTITIPYNGNKEVSFTEISFFPVPLSEVHTSFKFVKNDIDRNALDAIPITVAGLLQEKLTSAGVDPIKATLKIQYTKESPKLTMEFFVPSSPLALEIFKKNKNLITNLKLFCDYQILYQVNGFSSDKEIDYFRYKGSFGTLVNLVLPDTATTPLQYNDYVEVKNSITVDFPEVSTQVSPDDPEVTIVTNDIIGNSIKVPTNLVANTKMETTEIAVNMKKNNAPYVNGGLSGDRWFNTVSVVELSPDLLYEKRNLFSYATGISIPNLSVVETRTQAPFNIVNQDISQDFSVTGRGGRKLLFSDKVDDSVAGVYNINKLSKNYSDFYYNTLSLEKIKISIHEKASSVLESTLGLNGQSLDQAIYLSLKEALVRGEETFFALDDIIGFQKERLVTEAIKKNTSQLVDNVNSMDTVLQEAISINPLEYDIKTKNRLFNWKTLAEDLNKRVIYKTTDLEEHITYIPNNEKITVKDSAGIEHSFEMQDGDFFNASVEIGSDRLTVFSDIEKAYALNCTTIEKAAFLANEDYNVTLDCCSTTSDLVEYDVDVTSTRSDYYFLSLDKDTIENLPGPSLFTRKTGATYNYTTTGIDNYVKHKAFPYAVIYLRHDDMLLNHLESSKIANFIFTDFTLDNFSNTPDMLLPRAIPQHVVIIPTDLTTKAPYHTRSKLVSFNKRQVKLKLSPFLTDIYDGLATPFYLKSEITTTDSVNFTSDVEDHIVYQEGLKYSLNSTELLDLNKYKNNAEVLPRAILPVPMLLKKLASIKTDFSLQEKDSISFHDLYSQLQPKIFRSISVDSFDINDFNSKLRFNIITDDKEVNKTKFIQVKEISNIDNKSATLLDFPEGVVWSTAGTLSSDAFEKVEGEFIPTPSSARTALPYLPI